MNRWQAATVFRIAGYHGDPFPAWLYAESRIKMTDAQRAMREGRTLRKQGVKCGCAVCVRDQREVQS